MNPDDPTPLATQDADPFVQALLRAGRRERAPKGAERRLLAMLGVGGVSVIAAVARLAGRLGPKGMLTSAVIAAAVIGVGLWAFVGPSHQGHPQPAPANEAPSAPLVAPAVAAHVPEPELPSVPVTRVEDLPSPPAAGAAKVTGSARPSSAAQAGSSLAREVELIEAARAALARGDAAGALRSLDTHDREVPAGTLMPESRVLRIEALVRAGGDHDLARANALGDAFLVANPAGPQARRVRAVLDRTP